MTSWHLRPNWRTLWNMHNDDSVVTSSNALRLSISSFLFSFYFFLNVCFSKHGFNLLMHCVVFFLFWVWKRVAWAWMDRIFYLWLGYSSQNWDCRFICSALIWRGLVFCSTCGIISAFMCTIMGIYVWVLTLMMSACFCFAFDGHCFGCTKDEVVIVYYGILYTTK